MYVNYFNRIEKLESEKPTIGILLCASKNESAVRFTLPNNEKNIIGTLLKISNYGIKIDTNFMYNKWTKENIIAIMNYNIDKNLYNNIFQYTINNPRLARDWKSKLIYNVFNGDGKKDLFVFELSFNIDSKVLQNISLFLKPYNPIPIKSLIFCFSFISII